MNKRGCPDFTVVQILAWADAYHAAYGYWPGRRIKPGKAESGETWDGIDQALRYGRRGLPGGISLRQLLVAHRGPEVRRGVPALSEETILAWADAHHAATGRWPTRSSGVVSAAPAETWQKVEQALRQATRGLAGGTTLARVLAAHRGARNNLDPPRLTVERILAWADAHHAATGRWPTRTTGVVAAAPAESWTIVEQALRLGLRGLAGGATLARLLAVRRGARYRRALPRLTVERIVGWAVAHHAATGRWPTRRTGPVSAAPGETWSGIHAALHKGHRGLPGGVTLAQVLADRTLRRRPTLTVALIRSWAKGHHAATGIWPDSGAGPVAGVRGENWSNINRVLRCGHRGLPGGTNLTKVLGALKNPDNPRKVWEPTIEQVLAWADAHHAVTGGWPNERTGRVHGAPGVTWREVNQYLRNACPDLPRGLGLTRLIAQHRSAPLTRRRSR